MPDETTNTTDDLTRAESLTASDRVTMYLPIVRVAAEADDWIVEGRVTSEEIDTYGTIFDYESAKRAFTRWRGNIREQHDPKKAVGRGIDWIPDDANKCITLRGLISKGAPDTWQKVEDGVLTGWSIHLKNGFKVDRVQRSGKSVRRYYDYDYLEVSLVDAPGSPKCDITIVRADGIVTDVISEQTASPISSSLIPDAVERSDAANLHAMRNQAMQLCGCGECQRMAVPVAETTEETVVQRALETALDRVLGPVYSRQQQFLARLAQHDFVPPIADLLPIDSIKQQLSDLQATVERVNPASAIERVQADVAAVKVEVERISAASAPGGPIMNGAYPVDKRLATDSRIAHQASQADVQAGLSTLQEQGNLDTQMKQLAAAALTIQRMQGRTGV